MLYRILATVQDWRLGYAIAAYYYIAIAAWNLLCYLLCVAFLQVTSTAFHGYIQRLKVGIDDEWHPHLFVVVYEFQNILAFLWHDCSLRPMP